MTDVYVVESHPLYFVYVDGKVYDTLHKTSGGPLPWSDQWDIAQEYKEYFEGRS